MRNEVWKLDDKAIIVLSGGALTVVDLEDLKQVSAFRGTWYEDRRKYTSYAAINMELPGGGATMRLMHTILIAPPEGMGVDHRNGSGLDNRRRNLRIASPGENAQNLHRARSHSTTGVLGVSPTPTPGRFRGRVVVEGKEIHLGTFLSIEEAAEAVREARERYLPFSTKDQAPKKG